MTRGSNFYRQKIPRIYGHRGARGSAPENTMAAFEEATRQNADGIELDVRLTADEEVVVMHDPDFARVTHDIDKRKVAETRFEQIRRIDLAGGHRIPMLREVLDFVQSKGLFANIEIKHDVPDRRKLVERVVQILREAVAEEFAFISSFEPRIVFDFGRRAPEFLRALLIEPTGWHKLLALVVSPINAGAIHLEERMLTRERVQYHKRKGKMVNVWTVNNSVTALRVNSYGVDGIITDEPGKIRQAIQSVVQNNKEC